MGGSMPTLKLLTFSYVFFSVVAQLSPSPVVGGSTRRILHQPLIIDSAPVPPDLPLPPPSPPYEIPFFPEYQNNVTLPPPLASPGNGNIPMPSATQPGKPAKKVAIAVSVGLVTMGMFSVLAFFLYRHMAKQPPENKKLFGDGGGDNSLRFDEGIHHSSFLYIGTVEPTRSSLNESDTINGSPYHKLHSGKMLERYKPSPDLQPLPPLPKPPSHYEHKKNSPPAGSSSSSSDDETYGVPYVSRVVKPLTASHHGSRSNGVDNVPHSKRTPPRSKLPPTPSPEIKYAIFPSSNKSSQAPRPPFSPPLVRDEDGESCAPKRPKFAPPPPPIPPPPPQLPISSTSMAAKTVSSLKVKSFSLLSPKKSKNCRSEYDSRIENPSPSREEEDEEDGGKCKLRPLHWDKVRATSDRATVWDQIKSNSFQLNEGMMESLFSFNSTKPLSKEPNKKFDNPKTENQNRILDPKKSQNIAILLRALNVTRDEVSEALLDGNPESLGVELLETLVKMAPTKEEEHKLRNYQGDASKLGSAERFLNEILDIPFPFTRVEAMLYRANFDTEVKYLRGSFQTLQDASSELKDNRLFLKLLEAVLSAGNRMNIGTNRGDAKSFKLDTLLKLVDIKGTDGKTTLLHFVVQEVIRSESLGRDGDQLSVQEEDFGKKGLHVVSNLSRDLSDVKNAAGMDFDVLNSYVSKLESELEKVRSVLQYEQPDMEGKFFQSMKTFLRVADEEINLVKKDQKNAMELVKEVTQYFHGNAAKEEAHPLRIFMIVRDFLTILDHVCKEVGNLQGRSFSIPSKASLPVPNRFNVRKINSDEGS